MSTEPEPRSHDNLVRPSPRRWRSTRAVRGLVYLLGGAALVIATHRDFLFFHAVTELLCVAVFAAVFSIGWNTRAFVRDNLLLILAVASLPVGAIDALHMLAYKGMGVFDESGANLATQFWVAARLTESIAFALGAYLVGRKPLRPGAALIAFASAGALLGASIYPFGVFPTCFVEGAGLTPFKIVSEVIVALLFCVAALLLWHRRSAVTSVVLHPLLAAIGAKVLSELSFTAYANVYDLANGFGHVFKLVSAALLYVALVEGTLRRPYETLFRDLAKSEDGLQRELTQRRQTQAQLADAKEAAESANRAKSEFLASMSHEIRTPMNAIMGMTDLVLGTRLSAEQREFLTMARSSADSLLSVINDILDLSKIEAGRFEVEAVEFELPETVEHAVGALALRAHEKGLDLACCIGREVPRVVRGDAGRLRQVLINLLGNAVKFTERGEIVLRVTATKPAAHGVQTLHFAVSDTGPGIPEAVREKVFTSFFQADRTITRRYGGTGLGLSICRQIVEQMGGTIRVDSEVGAGSTFHVTVDFPVTQSATSEEPLDCLAGRKALIVDDHVATCEAVASMLARWGLEPQIASSWDEALAALRRARSLGKPYSLALVDRDTPVGDGRTALGAIDAERLVESPVIVMAAATEATVDHAGQSVARDYVMKPVRQSALFSALM